MAALTYSEDELRERAVLRLKCSSGPARRALGFDGDRGRYADRLLAAARNAKSDRRGLWGACRARLDPTGGIETREKRSISPPPLGFDGGGDCMSGYSPCLPIVGDLDCADVEALGKAPVRVTGSDPYRLDGDDDGVGCE
jgi:hypothetical protein